MTGKLHTPLANRFWYLNKDATYIPEDIKDLIIEELLYINLFLEKKRIFGDIEQG